MYEGACRHFLIYDVPLPGVLACKIWERNFGRKGSEKHKNENKSSKKVVKLLLSTTIIDRRIIFSTLCLQSLSLLVYEFS